MLTPFLNRCSTAKASTATRSSNAPKTRRILTLEPLEDRITPSVSFGFAVGGDTTGVSQSYATATDVLGDVYEAGVFNGTVHIGGTTLTAKGTADAYIAKFSSSGALYWVADLGGAGDSVTAYGVAVDLSGNVYTVGSFIGLNANMDPNSTNHKLSSSNSGADDNAFVSKLNSSGQYVFAKDLGFGGNAFGQAIALDSSGDVYTTGAFIGTNLAFNPAGGDLLSSPNNDNGFVSKLTSAGAFVFGVDLGSNGAVYPGGIAVDGNGSVYTTGDFVGKNVNFNPFFSSEQLTSSTNGTDHNAYVSKLTSTGQALYAVDLGYGGYADGAGIAVNAAGDAYSTGFFYGKNVQFDPTGNSDPLSSSHNGVALDAYVSELSPNGQFIFGKMLGNGGVMASFGIGLDQQGNVYTTGYYVGSLVSFDPNGTDQYMTSANSGNDQDAFLSVLTSSGQYQFCLDLGYGGTSTSSGVAVTGGATNRIVYTSGYFTGTNVDFNPIGSKNLSSPSGKDASFVSAVNYDPVQIATTTLPGGLTNSGYDQTLSYVNGIGSDLFAISNGALPPGLSINFSTGEISGTPQAEGTYTFTVTVNDAFGEQASQTYSVNIQSQFAGLAYTYTNAAYIYAYDAYVTGKGSYTAFLNEYYANYFATAAYNYSLSGDGPDAESYAYYAYYYGYLGQYYAYQDYANSGGTSTYSYYAYYDGYYGQYYSYYTSLGY